MTPSTKRKVKVVLVTPEIAERWLNTCNTHNRPIRNNVVNKYTDAMKKGDWRLTAEPIAFCYPYTDSTGKQMKETLINGQHRLWAVVNSGTSVGMTVWWGCEPNEFEVIDQGAMRTYGDVFATTRPDLGDPTIIASVCSSVLEYGIGLKNHLRFLRQAHLTAVLNHLEPEVLAVATYKRKLRKFAPRSVVSALMMAQMTNPSMTALIVNQLQDAVGFTDKDPIRALHMYLADQLAPTARDSRDTAHYKICHAIAARLRGEHIRILRITSEGLAYLRDGSRSRCAPLLTELFGGKVPHSYYNPKIMLNDGVLTPTP